MSRPNGFWVGHPGALLPLPGIKGDLVRSVERAVSYKTSASGRRRAYIAARRAPLREWKVTIPWLQPQEAALLHGLIMDTEPPYVWVDPWSRVTNLLTPEDVALMGAVPSLMPLGRQPILGGGWAPTAGANIDGVPVDFPPAPVVPDEPVTVSAFLTSAAGGTVSAVFLDTDGAQVGAVVTSAPVVGEDVLRRASVTVLVPPDAAAAVSVRVDGAAVISQPAVTWTEQVTEFGAGGGAAQVIIPALEDAIRYAPTGPKVGKRISDLSFTVTEVG